MLSVQDLQAGYGASQVLFGVSLDMSLNSLATRGQACRSMSAVVSTGTALMPWAPGWKSRTG